jgi:hypothetical protein
MPSSIFAHKGSEIQRNRSSYGLRAVETPERAAPISLPDSHVAIAALDVIEEQRFRECLDDPLARELGELDRSSGGGALYIMARLDVDSAVYAAVLGDLRVRLPERELINPLERYQSNRDRKRRFPRDLDRCAGAIIFTAPTPNPSDAFEINRDIIGAGQAFELLSFGCRNLPVLWVRYKASYFGRKALLAHREFSVEHIGNVGWFWQRDRLYLSQTRRSKWLSMERLRLWLRAIASDKLPPYSPEEQAARKRWRPERSGQALGESAT